MRVSRLRRHRDTIVGMVELDPSPRVLHSRVDTAVSVRGQRRASIGSAQDGSLYPALPREFLVHRHCCTFRALVSACASNER
jgi:hypothetical protein